jgi:hypothetical protein
MLSALIFLNATLFERLVSVKIWYIQLGSGDIFILIYFLYVAFTRKRILIPREFLILAVLFATSILLSIIANLSIFGFNTLVTVPLKIILAGIICSSILKSKSTSRYTILIDINIILYIFFLIFLSDALQITNLEFFNRNELVAYTSALFCLRAVSVNMAGNREVLSLAQLWLPIGILGFIIIIAQSRQSFLALIAASFALYLYSSLNKKAYILRGLVLLFCLTLITEGISTIELDGYEGSRLKTLQTLEPATRADRQRLANIFQGINGVIEKPIFGHGPTSFRRNNEFDKVSHNSYITAAYELGLFGLIIVVSAYIRLARPLSIKTQDLSLRRSSLAIGCMIVFFITQSAFIETLGKAPFYIFILCSVYIVQKAMQISLLSTNLKRDFNG